MIDYDSIGCNYIYDSLASCAKFWMTTLKLLSEGNAGYCCGNVKFKKEMLSWESEVPCHAVQMVHNSSLSLKKNAGCSSIWDLQARGYCFILLVLTSALSLKVSFFPNSPS